LQISSFFAGIIVDVIVLVTSKSEEKDQEEKEEKKKDSKTQQKDEKEKKDKKDEKKNKSGLSGIPGGLPSRLRGLKLPIRGRTGAAETLPLSQFENTSPDSDSDDDMRDRV
jgi:hypothetical protein